MNASLQPVVGDPIDHRATFTRFILPFRWKLEGFAAPSEDSRYYRPACRLDWLHHAGGFAPNDFPHFDRDRRRYLTRETDRLLFERASWFVLKTQSTSTNRWKEFEIESGIDGWKYRVAARPPAIILFETPPNIRKPDEDSLSTGFLVQELFFPREESAPRYGDVLRLNEIFRYWRYPYAKHQQHCRAELVSLYKGWTGEKEPDPPPTERLYASHWLDLLRFPIRRSKVWERIMPLQWLEQGLDNRSAFPEWLVNPDDRAFAMTFMSVENSPCDLECNAKSEEGPASARQTENLLQSVCGSLAREHSELTGDASPSGWWVKLLNVDRPYKSEDVPKCSPFELDWARKRTYLRWSHAESLYGCCEHNFAVLTAGVSELDEGDSKAKRSHGEPEIALHFGQMYFDTTLLILYLRVTLFRLSNKLHEISCDARDEHGDREFEGWKEPFQRVRWEFLMLENLYQFPLLSNQQQHLEIFELQRQAMDIREIYGEIEKEIRSSDELLNNRLDDKRNELAVVLNIVASVGLMAALALGWMDAHDNAKGLRWFWTLLLTFFVGLWILMPFVHPLSSLFQRFANLPRNIRKKFSVKKKSRRRVDF